MEDQDQKAGAEKVPIRGVMRRMKDVMSRAGAVPTVTGFREIDVTDFARARESGGTSSGHYVPSYTGFLASAVVSALQKVPEINARFDEDSECLWRFRDVNLGIAVASPRGLVVPVIRGAQSLGMRGLDDKIAELTSKAQAGQVEPKEMLEGTCTITSFAQKSGWFATPILRLPEVAIVGFGKVQERPWVVGGSIGVASVLPMSLTVDHRFIDGALAGDFSNSVIEFLEGSWKSASSD